MQIKRTLDTAKATYDITGLTKEQFSKLFHCYEKQMYIWHNRYPDPEEDELLKKLKEMSDSDTLII